MNDVLKAYEKWKLGVCAYGIWASFQWRKAARDHSIAEHLARFAAEYESATHARMQLAYFEAWQTVMTTKGFAPDWLTNDDEYAARFKAIDAAYLAARKAAETLPLVEKIEAYRKAKNARHDAYDAIRDEFDDDR